MAVFHDVTAATISGAFAFGMVLTLFGSLKLALSRRFHDGPDNDSDILIAWLLFAFNLALIPMVLLSGVLLDWIKAPYLMVLGSVLTALALFSLAFTTRGHTDFKRAMLASLMLGLGGACLLTSSLFLMPRAFFRSDPTVNNLTSAAVNVGTVFVALGAVIMPVLADLLLRVARFRVTLLILGVLALVPMVVVFLTAGTEFQPLMQKDGLRAYPWDTLSHSHDLSPLLSPELWTNWNLWLVALICFVYLPVEFSINTWATTFLRDHRYNEAMATYLLSGYWLSFVFSRLFVGALAFWNVLTPGTNVWLIVGMAVLSAVCLGNLASSGRPGRALVGLFLLGMFLGPIFPTLVAVVFNGLSNVPKGTAFGLMYAFGALGNLLLTPLIGRYANKKGVRVALYLPLLLMAILVGLSIALAASHQATEPAISTDAAE